MTIDNRTLAENLYKLIETSEDDILRGKCHSGRDHQIAPAIYRLLRADKDAPVYALVCCLMAAGCGRSVYARQKYLEEAIACLRKNGSSEDKIALVQKPLDCCIEQTTIQKLADERVVHPNALCRIKGIEYFDETKLNFHDAWLKKLVRLEKDFKSDIELELKPTWTDHSFRFKLNDVIDFYFNCGCNFVEIGWVSFYLYNGYLVCDIDRFGTISCHDAEIVDALALADKLKEDCQ